MLRELTINILLVEVLEQIPGYAKFMKYLITKNRKVNYEPIDNVHHCSAKITKSLVEKKEDPGEFTIPCTIGSFNFNRALCNLGASINLIPFVVFKKLGLVAPKLTIMRLVMVDGTMKTPFGILYNVLVKVFSFIFYDDFVILYCEV